MASERTDNALEFNLAGILNILWRRRLIVLGLPALGLIVGMLYGFFGTKRWSAEATVRPGITAFSPEGAPFRQWQLKDITTWYDRMMYVQDLNRKLGLPQEARTVIRADFIATGLTNLAGGEVVSLWTTATSPEMARAIIDTSITLFNQYAEADTLSSQIKLTRDGLELQVKVLETRLVSIEKQEASLNLQLQAARADSLVVAVLDKELGIELEKLASQQEFYRNRLKSLADARPQLVAQGMRIDELVASVEADASGQVDPQTIPAWVRRDAVLDGGDVMDSLASIRLRLQQQLDRNAALQDSFTFELQVAALEYGKRQISRQATVEAHLREIEQKIGDLQLEKDYELEVKRRELDNDIKSRQVQMGALSPLQRLGKTLVSGKPVRPRGVRATLILVFLGTIGGLVLAFVWDYVRANRREIFRS